VPGELLEFTITAQIVPPVKLGDFRKLKVKQPPVKITDQDVREVVDNLLTSAAKKEPVKRAAENGDEVVLDFDGRDKENQPIAGAKATDYPLLLGSDSFIPGFEKGIIGHKAGEKFDLALTFPKDYQAKNLAGAKVTFKINLKRVLAVKKPTYDDKFAATIHPTLKTTADLEKDIRRELQARAEYDARQRFRNDLLAALVDKSSVDIPEILIDDQLKAMENNFQQNLSSRGQTEEDYLKSQGFPDHDDFIKRELRPAAEDRVKSSLVLAELSRSFGVEISQEEISARQKQVVEQYTDPKLRQQFESPEARREIANQLAIDQTLDKLAEANSKSTL
jgi:trigger factor